MTTPTRFATSLRRAVAGALLLGVPASPATGFAQAIADLILQWIGRATRPSGATDRTHGAGGPLLRRLP